MRSVQVRDVMQHQVPTITAHMPLTTAVKTLLEKNLSGLPVVDDQHRVIGFLSEQDCIHALLVSSYHGEGDPEVIDVMVAEPVVVSPADNMVDLAQNLGHGKPKVYPVTEGGRLVGIISRTQILQKLANMGSGWGESESA